MGYRPTPVTTRCTYVADCDEPGRRAMAREIRSGLTIHVSAVCDRHVAEAAQLGFETRPPAP